MKLAQWLFNDRSDNTLKTASRVTQPYDQPRNPADQRRIQWLDRRLERV